MQISVTHAIMSTKILMVLAPVVAQKSNIKQNKNHPRASIEG